jgi:hypothetical protein
MMLAAGLILAGALGLQPVHALVASDYRSARPVLVHRVAPGDTIALGFLHSVEQCWVLDRLRVDGDFSMVVVETEFASSRTGLPYAAFGQERYQREGDRFRIRNMHRRVPEIFQWVAGPYRNTLQINDNPQIRLSTLAGDTLLHIRIRKMSALSWSWLKARSYWHHRSNDHG